MSKKFRKISPKIPGNAKKCRGNTEKIPGAPRRAGSAAHRAVSPLLQMAATIDMNFQSDLLAIFEENLF